MHAVTGPRRDLKTQTGKRCCALTGASAGIPKRCAAPWRQWEWTASRRIHFHAGESIHTENSFKYAVEEFAELAAQAGFRQESVWTDQARLFSAQLLVRD